MGGSPESACFDYGRNAAEQDDRPNDSDSGTEAEIGRRLPAETAPERPCPLPNCVRKAGDGVCDPECDRVECGWDGADCDGSAVHPFSRCPAEAFCAKAFRNSKCDPVSAE
ncbi:unnamed protein product [Anisakis simplex]|uniref:LNR domain-containing protein n=1 Tax=Anisakis simplex TaxID=6269 RepID=A0A0M3JM15_ANISI|nr:unnamed protein product [Anisakis simplex]